MTSLSTIWGVESKDKIILANESDFYEPTYVPIEQRIRSFLQGQINQWEPDLIIVLERKATAVLRALKENKSAPLEWAWNKVLSSTVLDQVSSQELANKRILVFDDMMKKGNHVERLLNKLKEKGIDISSPSQVRVAIFAVHEENNERIENSDIPHAWYYRDLTDTSYRIMREQIVSMIQEAGSLLLDTEHIEVRVRVKSGINELVEALTRRADAIVFQSAGERTNITVVYPDDDKAYLLDPSFFPQGTKTTNIVKKCRVVQRAGNEFALIPLGFPSLPVDSAWNLSSWMRELVGEPLKGVSSWYFYAAGLISALEILSWVLKDLAASSSKGISVYLPTTDVRSDSIGYSLEHLKVIYPHVNLSALNRLISQAEEKSVKKGRELRGTSNKGSNCALFSDSQLHKNAIDLIQMITRTLDEKRVEEYWIKNKQSFDQPDGLCVEDIFRLGKKLGWEKLVISALFDILIDEAMLVTHVHQITGKDGVERTERTFEPDGEVVTQAIRQYTTEWGLPIGIR